VPVTALPDTGETPKSAAAPAAHSADAVPGSNEKKKLKKKKKDAEAASDPDSSPATATAIDAQAVKSEQVSDAVSDSKKKKKNKKHDEAEAFLDHFRIKARLMAGWEYDVKHPETGPADVSRQFFLEQARIGFSTEYKERLQLKASIELSDGLKGAPKTGDVRFLRDAWLSYRFHPMFEAKIGRFKQPFSRLELRSSGDLPFRGRGLGNGLVVEDLGYGGRAIGVEFEGKLPSPDLTLHVAGSNPGAAPGLDTYARLTYQPFEWLSVSVSYAHKIQGDLSTQSTTDYIAGNGWGADLRVQAGGLYLLVDASLAEDLRYGNNPPAGFPNRPDAGSIAGYASYAIPLSKRVALEPTVFGEWVDRDVEFEESEAVRMVISCNLTWRETALRLMPQVELRRPLGTLAEQLWTPRETYLLMLSSEL
jgi:Phosphate-selective porin O and P